MKVTTCRIVLVIIAYLMVASSFQPALSQAPELHLSLSVPKQITINLSKGDLDDNYVQSEEAEKSAIQFRFKVDVSGDVRDPQNPELPASARLSMTGSPLMLALISMEPQVGRIPFTSVITLNMARGYTKEMTQIKVKASATTRAEDGNKITIMTEAEFTLKFVRDSIKVFLTKPTNGSLIVHPNLVFEGYVKPRVQGVIVKLRIYHKYPEVHKLDGSGITAVGIAVTNKNGNFRITESDKDFTIGWETVVSLEKFSDGTYWVLFHTDGRVLFGDYLKRVDPTRTIETMPVSDLRAIHSVYTYKPTDSYYILPPPLKPNPSVLIKFTFVPERLLPLIGALKPIASFVEDIARSMGLGKYVAALEHTLGPYWPIAAGGSPVVAVLVILALMLKHFMAAARELPIMKIYPKNSPVYDKTFLAKFVASMVTRGPSFVQPDESSVKAFKFRIAREEPLGRVKPSTDPTKPNIFEINKLPTSTKKLGSYRLLSREGEKIREIELKITPDVFLLDMWKLPRQMLIDRAGDCEDHANLITSILIANGVPAVTVVGTLQGGKRAWWGGKEQVTHVWTEAEIDGKVYIVDQGFVLPQDHPLYKRGNMMFDDKGNYEYTPYWNRVKKVKLN